MYPIHCGRGNKTINDKKQEALIITRPESEIPLWRKNGQKLLYKILRSKLVSYFLLYPTEWQCVSIYEKRTFLQYVDMLCGLANTRIRIGMWFKNQSRLNSMVQ